jgi:transposase
MDHVEQLIQDVREGRIDPDRLVGLVVTLQRQLQEAHWRIEELEKKLGGSGTAKTAEPFSMRAEERRQQARGKKSRKRQRPLRCGRINTADKIALAERTEKVFPVGVAPSDCRPSHTRPVWRLENGRAVLVAYEVYRGPRNQFGSIPGTLGRSEFGLEIILAIAYQIYIIGLSFDKVCLLMNFFQNLRLGKSQADSLMNQLSRHWAVRFPQGRP